jgi:very-short-patch-repair endonuclease
MAKENVLKKQKRETNQRKGSIYSLGLKKRATKHEIILRDALLECGIIFKFQKVFYNEHRLYILDFYLKTMAGRYCIEVDGSSHDSDKQKEYDFKRSQWLLAKRKTKTIRFTNEQVDNDLLGCVAKILMLEPKRIKINQ